MTISPQLWIFLRVFVVLIISWGIAGYDSSKSNVDWLACLLIASFGGMFLFLWLLTKGNCPDTDWSNPMSISQPFLPMNRYPIRYWLLVGISLILGGVLAIFKGVVRSGQNTAFSATTIALGIAFILAVGIRMRR